MKILLTLTIAATALMLSSCTSCPFCKKKPAAECSECKAGTCTMPKKA